jgi:hypothetical protein
LSAIGSFRRTQTEHDPNRPPPDNEQIKLGILEKKVIATIVSWKPQHAMLACDRLVFTKDASSQQVRK